MISHTISARAAQRLYDLVGKRYDWFEFYEGRAKARARECLDLAPGLKLLNVGIGTGREHAHLQPAVAPDGAAFGLDLSPVMLKLARAATSAPVCQADARRLPCAAASVDRLYAAYILDLIPVDDLRGVLAECRRVLSPGGRLVALALTEGVDRASRAFVAAWKAAYAVSPIACGGCRPLQLARLVEAAGFRHINREVIVQMGLPSEIVLGVR